MAQTTEKKRRTVQAPPAIVRVIRPNLTPEEREKRMKELRKACVNILLAQERAHQELAKRDGGGR